MPKDSPHWAFKKRHVIQRKKTKKKNGVVFESHLLKRYHLSPVSTLAELWITVCDGEPHSSQVWQMLSYILLQATALNEKLHGWIKVQENHRKRPQTASCITSKAEPAHAISNKHIITLLHSALSVFLKRPPQALPSIEDCKYPG